MTLPTSPDVGRLVQWFLLAQSEVTDVVDQEIYRTPPETRTYPWVRVTAFAGTSIARSLSGPLRFAWRTPFQIDAFGGDEEQARNLADLCAAALEMRLTGNVTFGGVTAVVTSVEVGTPRPMPADYSGNDVAPSLAIPAKPRFMVDGIVVAALAAD